MVLDQPDAMSGITSIDIAMKVTLHFCKMRGWREVITLLQYSPIADRLLGAVADIPEGKDFCDLVSAMVESDPGLWGNGRGRNSPFNSLNSLLVFNSEKMNQKAFSHLIRNHRVFLMSNHPLTNIIHLDIYWCRQILPHIQRGSWRRAWEEIKKAAHGVCLTHIPGGEPMYVLKISKTVLGELISGLFEKMLAKGLVEVQPEKATVTNMVRREVFQLRTKALRTYKQQHTKPGWNIACIFPAIIDEGRFFGEKTFNRTGLQALEIAHFVSMKRNEKRKKKWQKLTKKT